MHFESSYLLLFFVNYLRSVIQVLNLFNPIIMSFMHLHPYIYKLFTNVLNTGQKV